MMAVGAIRGGAPAHRRAVGRRPTPREAMPAGGQPFRRALVISLLNPKAILFFISFFIQFLDPTYAYPGAVVPAARARSCRCAAPSI